MKFAPPKFHEGSDLEMAENWFQRMVEIFATLNYAEERQENFTVFQFEGAMRSWWDVIRAKWEKDKPPGFGQISRGSLTPSSSRQ